MDLYKESISIILKNQSKSGSYVASPNFNNYKFSWMRDGSFIAYSMDLAGEVDSAESFYNWVDSVICAAKPKIDNLRKTLIDGEKVDASSFLNCRYTLDGKEEENSSWGNFQIDAYGTWLWGLAKHIEKTGKYNLVEKYRKSIDLTIEYIKNLWYYPNFDVWEENCDKIHTSTLACLYGGLDAIEKYYGIAKTSELKGRIRSYILTNCVKNGQFIKYVGARDEVDASLLWLAVPFNVVACDDPIFVKTEKKIEDDLLVGEGIHRNKADTYYGGGQWVLLSCFLGLYYNKIGEKEKAKKILAWAESSASKEGFLPEQVFGDMNDSSFYQGWVEKWGKPASPLLWSHAMYIALKKSL